MVRFAGYAKKEDPKWITILIYSGVVVLAFVLLFAISFISQWLSDRALEREKAAATSTTASTTVTVTGTVIGTSTLPVTVTTLPRPSLSEVIKSQPAVPSTTAVPAAAGLTVSEIVLSSAVAGNQPTDDIAAISISAGRVYCFTRIKCQNPPQKIQHVWIKPNGSVYTDIDLTISREDTFTWSYITLSNAYTGEWSVEVRDSSGAVVGKKSFSITE